MNTDSKNKRRREISQSMRWHITINNPLAYGLDRKAIKGILGKFKLSYWCMVDEIAPTTGTPHTHIVIVAEKSKIRFSTIQRRFLAKAHIESLHYDIDTNINYMNKDLHDYSNFEEFGKRPQDSEGTKSKKTKQGSSSQLLAAIKDDLTTDEILEKLPSLTLKVHTVEHLERRHLRKKILNKPREIPLVCIVKTGATGTGKTRSTMEEAQGSIYRVTYYRSNRGGPIFDNYEREKYLCFEEFSGSKSVQIEEMLTYIDPWNPCTLASRYTDGCSCYTHVIINTNLPFESLYSEETFHNDRLEHYLSWLRRITEIQVYKRDRTIEKYSVAEYMKKVFERDQDLSQRIMNYLNHSSNKENI